MNLRTLPRVAGGFIGRSAGADPWPSHVERGLHFFVQTMLDTLSDMRLFVPAIAGLPDYRVYDLILPRAINMGFSWNFTFMV